MLLASLIIPTYNVEKFIPETLESVKRQTAKPSDFEVIILDDGSTDNTVNTINNNIKGMKNIRFFSRGKNWGLPGTWNQAIGFAQGENIILLDGDDLLEPEAIESTLNFMKIYPNVQYSYSKHKRIDKDGNFICARPGYSFSRERLLHFNFVGHLKCFKKDLHKKIKGFDPDKKYGQDWDFVLRVSEVLEKNQIAQNPQHLYRYRIHSQTISSNKTSERKIYTAKSIKDSLKSVAIMVFTLRVST